jgi:hypothetical protein
MRSETEKSFLSFGAVFLFTTDRMKKKDVPMNEKRRKITSWKGFYLPRSIQELFLREQWKHFYYDIEVKEGVTEIFFTLAWWFLDSHASLSRYRKQEIIFIWGNIDNCFGVGRTYRPMPANLCNLK